MSPTLKVAVGLVAFCVALNACGGGPSNKPDAVIKVDGSSTVSRSLKLSPKNFSARNKARPT